MYTLDRIYKEYVGVDENFEEYLRAYFIKVFDMNGELLGWERK